jgi:DNA primase
MQPYLFSKQDEEREKKWKEYSIIFNRYVSHYHSELLKNENLGAVREYLKGRSLGKDQVKKFKIGFIEKNPNYFDELKKDFSEQAILDTGLFYLDEKKKIYVERFKGRLIFPINNLSGQPIALGGRIIEKIDYLAKYINSPETIFFKKGSHLYNLDFARKLSNKLDSVYLVEGYMDVVGLSKNGIENVVANLGTSLTDKQIQILNQFYDDIIICFDGDESGYKAALRAAENSIKELKPEKQISFLFLPNNEDPDSYVNKKGKIFFSDFTKQSKISIHQFIFSHYKKETKNNPSSMATLEKKLKLIANTIRDDYIKKYVLEYFLEKIDELTPHLNQNKNRFNHKKKIKSLDSTKKIFKESQSFTSVELKEYSLLYLLINNLDLIQENLHLVDNIKLFTEVNTQIFDVVLGKLKSGEKQLLNEMNIDKQLLDKVEKFAPIKNLLKNKSKNDYEILELFEDISRDLMNYDLEHRIKELESKFSKDLSEVTFNELKELKKKQNVN